MSRSTEEGIAQHFDEGIDCCAPPRDPSKRPGVALARLLSFELKQNGLAGRSVLELGCGRGELTLELVKDGAVTATGIDLSPSAIEYARTLARDAGLADRLMFTHGNSATMSLEPHDVVVHNRVICCYPDATAFLQNSIAAARSVYAFCMPRSRGFWGALMRIGLKGENALHAIKRREFRAFVHDERLVHDALTTAGFAQRARTGRFGWLVAIYVKA